MVNVAKATTLIRSGEYIKYLFSLTTDKVSKKTFSTVCLCLYIVIHSCLLCFSMLRFKKFKIGYKFTFAEHIKLSW